MAWTDPAWLTLAAALVGSVLSGALTIGSMRTRFRAVERALTDDDGNPISVRKVSARTHSLVSDVAALQTEVATLVERQSGHVVALETHEKADERRFQELRDDFKEVKDAINEMNRNLVVLVRRSTPPGTRVDHR